MGDADYPTSTQGEGRCPRCGEGPLKAWYELSAEEREVVERLPASAELPLAERASRGRWCTRCWHEESSDTQRNA